MSRAIYPGTFDPPTLGHLDIVERSARLFDEVIVLLAVNSKKQPLFELQERRALIEECVQQWKNVRVDLFDGLVVDYARQAKAEAVIRGLRAVSDFDYEAQMALVNTQMAPDVETVFLLASEHHVYINSSIVRELFRYGEEYTRFVPEIVIQAMRRKRAAKGAGA